VSSRPVALLFVLALLAPASTRAEDQAARSRLTVTVVDQTAAVVPRASVAAERSDTSEILPASARAATNGVGVAMLEGLEEGRYTVTVEFPGFDATR